MRKNIVKIGELAQSVEQQTPNLQAVVSSTTFLKIFFFFFKFKNQYS